MTEITFEALLAKMQALHDTKDHDYAGSERYANFRGSAELGIPPHIGAALRMRDKFSRAMNLLRNEWAANDARGPAVPSETVEDTLLDLANYALIVLCLRAEQGDTLTILPGTSDCAKFGCVHDRLPHFMHCGFHLSNSERERFELSHIRQEAQRESQ